MFDTLSSLISEGIPTFFYTDFKGDTLFCCPIDELETHDIEFSFENTLHPTNNPHRPQIIPVAKNDYKQKFDLVQHHLRLGNTYLLNLTQPTPLYSPYSLQEIYTMAHAPFKLRVKDEFVTFSPEAFITIDKDTLHTFPMKGTIDAGIENAQEIILNDSKERAEHTMIVDLLRNDLGMVARNIKVEQFRYVTSIKTGEKELLQVSSHISGKLSEGWEKEIGSILKKLLPAGSISGTPKKKSTELIEAIERYQRGYFSGVFGYYDGRSLYSAVSIRYIENTPNGYIYKSGGGITADSEWEKEYQEMLDKIYIP